MYISFWAVYFKILLMTIGRAVLQHHENSTSSKDNSNHYDLRNLNTDSDVFADTLRRIVPLLIEQTQRYEVIYVDETDKNNSSSSSSMDRHLFLGNTTHARFFHYSVSSKSLHYDSANIFINTIPKFGTQKLLFILDLTYHVTIVLFDVLANYLETWNRDIVWIGRYRVLPGVTIPANYITIVTNHHNFSENIKRNQHSAHYSTVSVISKGETLITYQLKEGELITDKTLPRNWKMSSNPVLKIVTIFNDVYLFERRDLLVQGSGCEFENSLACEKPTLTGDWELTCCLGFFVDLLQEMMKYFDFYPRLYIVQDGFYGGFNETARSFTGMIGDVVGGRADMAVATLTITNLRVKYVDFVHNFMETRVGLLINTESLNEGTLASMLRFNFIANLENNVVYLITGLFGFSIILVFSFEYLVAKERISACNLLDGKRIRWMDTCLYIGQLVFQHSVGAKEPRSMSGRAMSVFVALAFISISGLYTASMTADQVTTSQTVPNIGLSDEKFLNPTTDFKFGTVKESSMESLFKDSANSKLRNMHEFMKDYNTATNEEIYQLLIEGSLQGIFQEDVLASTLATQCQLKMLKYKLSESGYAFALPKGSKWLSKFSFIIRHLLENGRIAELKGHWSLPAEIKCTVQEPPKGYTMLFFAMPFILLASTIVFCFLLMSLQLTIGATIIGRFRRRLTDVKALRRSRDMRNFMGR